MPRGVPTIGSKFGEGAQVLGTITNDRLLDPTPAVAPLDLAAQPAFAELAAVGQQALSSARYDQFLSGASA